MTKEKELAYTTALEDALKAGYEILKKGGSSFDAVIAAVIKLEDCPLFNAGKGSVFTNEGKHEMDASVMRGDTLQAGAVAGVHGIRNPVLAARAVMEHTDHVFLYGAGAESLAASLNLAFEEESYFFEQMRFDQLQQAKKDDVVQLDHSDEKKFGTVGAVACDHLGTVSAATSTGGMTNKKMNRIGDSPVIGAGTYANNITCAISCTGHGEYFLRSVVAYDISCLMEYAGLSLADACKKVVNDKLVKAGGEGGLVAVDHNGNICMPFNSEGMYRGCYTDKGLETAIYK